MPVSEVKSGQTASFALKRIKRSQIRKGMVMVCPKLNPVACWEVIIFLKLHYQLSFLFEIKIYFISSFQQILWYFTIRPQLLPDIRLW